MKKMINTCLLVFMGMSLIMLSGCSSSSSTPAAPAGDPGTAATTYTISGTITGGTSVADITVTLTKPDATTTTATTDASGNYSFTGLSAGDYTVAPSKTGMTFDPASTTVTIATADMAANFTGSDVAVGGGETPAPAATTYTISGTVTTTDGSSVSNITLTLASASSGTTTTTTTDANGNYSFTGLSASAYIVTPSKERVAFNPAGSPLEISNTSVTANFAAAEVKTTPIANPAAYDSLYQCDDTGAASDTSDFRVGYMPDTSECDVYKNYRGFFKFDLSTIPSGSTITSVSLSFTQMLSGSPYDSGNTLTFSHIAFDSSNFAITDWDDTVLTSSFTSSDVTGGSVITITSDTLKSYVESDLASLGYTGFKLYFTNALTSSKYISITNTTGNEPTLTVTHYKF